MKIWPTSFRTALICATAGLWLFGGALSARAEVGVDSDAQSVLTDMANYLGGLKNFSVDYFATDEIVTHTGEKLQFLDSGTIIVQRPNHLFATRTGATGTSEMFLDGNTLSLLGVQANGYLQLSASNIDAVVDAVRQLGFDAPGADLLSLHPLDNPLTDIKSGTYVGDTFIDGIKVHQLAFRGADVDWQVWVTVGDEPLPLRYVIITKGINGAPEYILELKHWNTAPRTDASRFVFVPPQGAIKLAPASITFDAIGDMTIKGK